MDAAYRKNQTNLLFSGVAIIAFGIWSALKVVVYMGINGDAVLENMGFTTAGIEAPDAVIYGAVALFICLSVLFHLYLGLSAIRDARGKKRFRVYIPVAVMYACITIISYISEIIDPRVDISYGTLFISFLIDMTSIAALVLIVISSHNLKKIRMGKAEAGAV